MSHGSTAAERKAGKQNSRRTESGSGPTAMTHSHPGGIICIITKAKPDFLGVERSVEDTRLVF